MQYPEADLFFKAYGEEKKNNGLTYKRTTQL
jgi:hypothetical protein